MVVPLGPIELGPDDKHTCPATKDLALDCLQQVGF
jgi:hypothetical protein